MQNFLSLNDRRKFLQASATAAAATILPGTILNASILNSPNERPVFGVIGLRNQGWVITTSALDAGADVVALADLDSRILDDITDRLVTGRKKPKREAKDIKEGEKTDDQEFKGHKIKKPDTYKDYRKILDRDDIDAVLIATPDHWHAKIAIEAMLAGKDVYCEKPLTLTIAEGKLIERVVKETGKIFQVGTMQRSMNLFLQAVALVRSGRIGDIKKVTCGIGSFPTSPELPITQAPKTLDWDLWNGPAPKVDYLALPEMRKGYGGGVPLYSNGHYSFRMWHAFAGGKLTDWGAHHVDIANWACGFNKTGPSKITPLDFEMGVEHKDGYPVVNNRYNCATKFNIQVDLPNDVQMIITSEGDNGILFEGTKGRFFVNRGKIVGKPVEDLESNPLPENALEEVYGGPVVNNHVQNFINGMKTRRQPISDVWSHNRMLEICHLSNIAMRLGRPIAWDPDKREIVGDDQASSFLSRDYRQGYEIKM